MSTEAVLKVVLRDLMVSVDEVQSPIEPLTLLVAKRLGRSADDSLNLRILKRALDNRRSSVHFVFSVVVDLPQAEAKKLVDSGKANYYAPSTAPRLRLSRIPDGPRPVVIGAGPAGMFAALQLAEAGWAPILVERGKEVATRAKDVAQLYAHGTLNTESNVCYGEGGAGTFSDGKLYTRKNDPRLSLFLETLIQLGARNDIRVHARPHIGTDRLVKLLAALRERLIELGTEIRYQTKVEAFEFEEKAGGRSISKLILADGEKLDAANVIVATGHSAREVWYALDAAGVFLEARPFAVGYRIEHQQALIDEARYGKSAGHVNLPAAEYRLASSGSDEQSRACYSFCMCPGGVVVATPTHPGELCINGMSHASRSGRFANSAMVVTVGPEDYAAEGFEGVFAGVKFQEKFEKLAFERGGGNFCAPAMSVAEFMNPGKSIELGSTSYRRGLKRADLASTLPEPIIDTLKISLTKFDRKMPGFISEEAKLIGVETRTASPIRVPRGDDMQALDCQGLYVSGEGMGYGGGIASAAIDGMRVAEAMLRAQGAVEE